MRLLHRAYGATPLHLLAHLGALSLAAYAVLQLVGVGRADNVLLWFVGAVVLHDFLLLPFYSGLDRAGRSLAGSSRRFAINYVRVPLGLSALLALVYFPVICGKTEGAYRNASGVSPEGYIGRWLLASLVIFAGSALLYAWRARRADADATTR